VAKDSTPLSQRPWPWEGFALAVVSAVAGLALLHRQASGLAWYLGMATLLLAGALIAGLARALDRARKAAQEAARALAESDSFLKTLTDGLPGMIAYVDRDLNCRFANRAVAEGFGGQPGTLPGLPARTILGEKLYAQTEPYFRGVLNGEKQRFERAQPRADGSTAYSLVDYIPDVDADGQVAGFFVLANDVTELKNVEGELTLAASVFQNTIEGILVADADQVILSVNPAFTEITGYQAEEVIGRTPRVLKSDHHGPAFYAAMWREINTFGRWQGEIWNRRKEGGVYLEWLTITRIRNPVGGAVRYVSVFHDITHIRRNEDRINYLAFHDPLTDLPNRALLTDRLDHQIAKAQREDEFLAVLFLDLDGFKAVNDSRGHAVGDDLLKCVAGKLSALLRETDTVARLGGDEFIVVLDNPAGEDEVAQVAQRILSVIAEPMDLAGRPARVGVSIGIAMFPVDGDTPGDLIHCADVAMYAAKNAGKNAYRFFQPVDPALG